MFTILRRAQIAFPLSAVFVERHPFRATSLLAKTAADYCLPLFHQMRFQHLGIVDKSLSFFGNKPRCNSLIARFCSFEFHAFANQKAMDFIAAFKLPGAILCRRSFPEDPLFYIYQNNKIIATSDRLPQALAKEPIYLRSKEGDFILWP